MAGLGELCFVSALLPAFPLEASLRVICHIVIACSAYHYTHTLLPFTVDSPPLKKPKVEPSASPSKNPRSDTPTSYPNAPSNPCHSSNGLTNMNSDTPHSVNNNTSSLPPPPSLPPSSSLAQKSQVPSQSHNIMQNSISNHIMPQVSNSSTANASKSSRGTVNNHQAMSHYHMASIPNSSGLVPNSLEQSLHMDRQQQSQHSNNNDVSVQPLCMLYVCFSLLCVHD